MHYSLSRCLSWQHYALTGICSNLICGLLIAQLEAQLKGVISSEGCSVCELTGGPLQNQSALY